jgi:hypothetical protein
MVYVLKLIIMACTQSKVLNIKKSPTVLWKSANTGSEKRTYVNLNLKVLCCPSNADVGYEK